ncbi:Protein of unknown function DUF2052, coiled-coil [Phaffia rhodozyma]|uniref:CCD97-like C-terminal domain-containing protein n=1 Tax=Phaffia rhodozyma TaxID=264483 RepID=A0A0F7SLR9_PHARH|nr:Protein of unknown function DUF2052, coiled-coil [Phaffia rhodozyma]
MTNPLDSQEEIDPVLASQLHITSHEISTILQYLSLPPSTILPTPALQFLSTHLSSLPPSLAALFSKETTPKARASIAGIRNRRFRWANQASTPGVLRVGSGRERHPLLFDRIVGSGIDLHSGSSYEESDTASRGGNADEEEDDEEVWGQMKGVLGGKAKVGKFGALMKGFEEEREGERRRGLRREEIKAERETGEEFESDSDDDDDDDGENGGEERKRREEDTFWGEKGEDRIQVFERILKERWIDGLEDLDYDAVDYDETWDESSTESLSQDAWFDDEPATSSLGGVLTERSSQASGLAEGEYDY